MAARPRCAVLPSLASLTLVPTPVLEPSTEAAWCADGHDGSWLDDADQGTGEFPQQKDNPKRTVARELRDDERPNMESILRVCERLSNITTPLMSRKPKRIFPEKALMAAGGPLLCFDSLLAGIGMLTVGVWSIRGCAGVWRALSGCWQEHCADQSTHGDNPDVQEGSNPNGPPINCNAGKGGHFWRFRLHTLQMLGLDPFHVPARKPLQVLISVRKGTQLVSEHTLGIIWLCRRRQRRPIWL